MGSRRKAVLILLEYFQFYQPVGITLRVSPVRVIHGRRRVQKFRKKLQWERAALARLTYLIRIVETVLAPSLLAYVIEQKHAFIVVFVIAAVGLIYIMEMRERLAKVVKDKERTLTRYKRRSRKDSG